MGDPGDPAAIAATQATLVDLPVAEPHREGMLENLSRLAAMAALVKEFALPPADDTE